MPKISIIVPVYDVEQFLSRCLESILSQTFQDFEVILVNDGSTDNSYQICLEYARRDTRVVIIDKENGGLSSARNAGLNVAKGEYIGFVDSDDYIAPDMYDLLYKNIVSYGADISICSFYLVYSDGRIIHTKPKGICKCMSNEEAIRTLLSTKQFENHAWDKLYKKALFNQIRFPENELFEDIAVMHRLLDNCRKVIYESKPEYYYVQRPGSIVNSSFNIKKLQFVKQCQRVVDFSKSKGGLYDKEAQTYLALASLWLLYQVGLYKDKYAQILNELKANILNYYSVAINSKALRKSERFSLYLIKHGVSVYLVCKLHLAAKNIVNFLKVYLHKIKNLALRNTRVEGSLK